MNTKRRIAGAALLLCGFLATGETLNVPITDDIAIGNDGAKGYTPSLNDASNAQLAVCNYTC